MKQNVSYGWGSFWSFIFWCCLIALVVWCFCSVPYGGAYNFWWWILIFLLVWWFCDIIFYIPVGVSADDDNFRVRRVFNSRNIPMSEIASAQPYTVGGSQKGARFSPAAITTKWGTYTDPEIGSYEAYYSNPKKTVLITLKNGRKLVVGSADPKQLAEYINSRVK